MVPCDVGDANVVSFVYLLCAFLSPFVPGAHVEGFFFFLPFSRINSQSDSSFLEKPQKFPKKNVKKVFFFKRTKIVKLFYVNLTRYVIA